MVEGHSQREAAIKFGGSKTAINKKKLSKNEYLKQYEDVPMAIDRHQKTTSTENKDIKIITFI